jgi:hypothetical protein
VVTTIALIGWQETALLAAAAIVCLGLLSQLLLSKKPDVLWQPSAKEVSVDEQLPSTNEKSIYRDPRLYYILLVTIPLPFFSTGIIFFQATLGDELGWTPSRFATGFLCFAIVRAAFSLGVGAMADQIGPLRLLGSPLIFFAAGLLLLTVFGGGAIYPLFIFLGLAFGISSAITTPVLSQIFGLDRLGAARGAASSIAVFATAAAPAFFGLILGAGISARLLIGLSAGTILLGFWPFSIWVKRSYFSEKSQ